MLIRLLKYDLKKMMKFLLVFFLLALFFGTLTRILGNCGESIALAVIKGICNGTTISMMCSLLINCLMRSWVLFRSNLFGDESYLTHTLPVKKEIHYASKAFTGAISLFFCMVGIVAVLFITYWTDETWEFIKAFMLPISEHLGISILTIAVFLFFVLFIEFFNGIQVGYFGILIGHRFHQNKILFSVIFGFVGYMVCQTVSLFGMMVIGLLNSDFMKVFTSNDLMSFSPEMILSITIIGTAFYVLFSIVGFILNTYLLKKGVNVD